jgi:replicative DNA helicase
VLKVAEAMQEGIRGGKEGVELANASRADLETIGTIMLEERVSQLKETSGEFFDWLEESSGPDGSEAYPVKYGNDLDLVIGGLAPGFVHTISARSGMGKSIMGQNCAVHNAINGIPVLFFSMEMTKRDLYSRITCQLGKVDGGLVMSGRANELEDRDWDNLTLAKSTYDDLPIFLDDASSATPEEIAAISKGMIAKHGIGLVVVDHLSLMKEQGKDNTEKQLNRADKMRDMAKTLKIPVVVLAQQNREGAKRATPSNIQYSDALYHHSQTMLLIQDPANDPRNKDCDGIPPSIEIEIGKNRNGPSGISLWLTNRPNIFNIGPREFKNAA